MARVRFWYATAVVLPIVAYFAAPVARPGLIGAVGLAAVAAIEYGVRWWRPQRAGGWRLLAVSVALLAIGDVAFDARSPVPLRYPGISDVFYIASYLPLVIALLWLGVPGTPYQDQTSLIDVVSLTLAGSLIVWILLVHPELEAQGLSQAGRVAAVVSWVGYIAVAASSARIMIYWRRFVSAAVLTIAILAFLVSEFFYGRDLVRGVWTVGGPVDMGYFAFTGLCGAAALHPSMRDLASPAQAQHRLGPGRLTLIAVSLLVGPTALLIEAGRGAVRTGYAIAIITGLVSIFMLIRLAMTGRAYQRRAAREHAVRLSSQAMVAAITPQDVVDGARSALRTVMLDAERVNLTLADPYGAARHGMPAPGPAQPNTIVAAGPDDRGELALPLAGSQAALVFAAPIGELADLTDLLRSLADQAAVALQRIHLAGAAAAEERERYFRTLVLTSTDVILISRDERIEYATPSARKMFGRDVRGERFDDIVQPDPAALRTADGHPLWPKAGENIEATIARPDGDITVLVHRRDLTGDPTVRGVVTSMRDITAERELQRDLAYRASHDELTGLANVRSWGEALSAEADRRRGPGNGIGVIFIDLDHFKRVNDQYGHSVGDALLAEVARRIQSVIRADDLAARVGGDEFAVLLRGLPNVHDARVVAQRLAETLAEPAAIDSFRIDSHASVGLSYTETTERVPALARQADTALYAAKKRGRGRWTEYRPEQRAPARMDHDGSQERENTSTTS